MRIIKTVSAVLFAVSMTLSVFLTWEAKLKASKKLLFAAAAFIVIGIVSALTLIYALAAVSVN